MIKNNKIFLIILLIFAIFNFSLADSFGDLQNRLFTIFKNLITFLFQVLFLLSSIVLIYLGILYILGKTNIAGKNNLNISILYVVLGIVLLILSFFIPNFIKSFFQP
jgi:hypothetical protein